MYFSVCWSIGITTPAWTLGCRRISVLLCPLSTSTFQSTTPSPEVNLDAMDIDDEW
ncbi:putative signal peptide protein [Puccinia sorghi]|uniref:Putative signal peptide protein n=1 Tax=Puccinia sorghi TaxID=27349 RepID=A0A0L6U5W0_9BASI|nr:putative signal peptide protein [Puccinia sorghi]